MKCQQLTAKGTSCKWNAIPSEKYCSVHLKVSENKVKNDVNFGKMLMVSLTGIIKTIIRSEINSLSIHVKD